MFCKFVEGTKVLLAATATLALAGWFLCGIANDIVDGVTRYNEPVYLVARAHDPIFKVWGFVPDNVVCFSPARCEPNGKASPQYFILLKEYELRKWGLNPAIETPVKGNPFI